MVTCSTGAVNYRLLINDRLYIYMVQPGQIELMPDLRDSSGCLLSHCMNSRSSIQSLPLPPLLVLIILIQSFTTVSVQTDYAITS